MALNLQHQTVAELLNRVAARYRVAERGERARIANFIASGIDAGDFTETQVRVSIGLTVGQWAVANAALRQLAAAHNTIQQAI